MLSDNTAGSEETLVGFVYEIEERGWVKGIGISTGDEEYVVESNEWTDKLCKEVENDVRVTGYVSREAVGKNRILVTGYEVLREEDYYSRIALQRLQSGGTVGIDQGVGLWVKLTSIKPGSFNIHTQLKIKIGQGKPTMAGNYRLARQIHF